ncbi:hypothetical protein D3C72_1047730 [compost metagenome]
MKYIITCLVAGSFGLMALSPPKPRRGVIEMAVLNQRFTFMPETARPMEGVNMVVMDMFPNARDLYRIGEGNYTIQVTPDSLIVSLPYFGRSYTSLYGTTDIGFKFSSSKYTYQVSRPSKRNKPYEIQIKPLDRNDINRITVSVFDNGNATVYISSVNRNPISYQGTLVP